MRVTLDGDTRNVVAVVKKSKLRAIDVFVPSACLDYRISLSLIEKVVFPKDAVREDVERWKNKLCYTHHMASVDLMEVTDYDENTKSKKSLSFECELELLNMQDSIINEKRKMDHKHSNRVLENIQYLIQNTRLLINEMQ